MMGSNARALVSMVVVCLLPSCGLIGKSLVLKTRPPQTTREVLKERCVLSTRVADSREKKQVVGTWCNLSEYTVEDDVADLVQEALDAELVQRGYELGAGGAGVALDLKKFFNFACTHTTDEARVEFEVTVSGEGSVTLYSTTIYGGAKHTPSFWEMDFRGIGRAEKTLGTALSNAMLRLFEDRQFREALTKACSRR